MSYLWVEVYISICVSQPAVPRSCTVVINMGRNLFRVEFKPSTTSWPCPGYPTPWPIIVLYTCSNINNKYTAVVHIYFLAQPSIFSKIVLRSEKKLSFFQKNDNTFTVWSCSGSILVFVIRQKWVKHIMRWQITWWQKWAILMHSTEVIQCNTFNRYRYFSTIIFRLDLTRKNGNHTLLIISIIKDILWWPSALEWLTELFSTVMST